MSAGCDHLAAKFAPAGACPACKVETESAVREAAAWNAGEPAREATEAIYNVLHDARIELNSYIAEGDESRVALLSEKVDDLEEQIRELEGILLTLDSLEATTSLASFVRAAWHVTDPGTRLEWNWHHQLICDVVQGVLEDWLAARRDPTYQQRARNILFGLPPGALKSRILAVFLPAWMWVRCPSWTVLSLSINPKAALRDARACREVIESPWYQRTFAPAWRLKDDQDALTDYGNTAGGARVSRGYTAETVGLRADLLLIDDPNNPKAPQCEAVNEAYDAMIWNRVNSLQNSCRFIVQQRVDVDDLTGHLLRTSTPWSTANPGGWMHVCLPAEFDPERACRTPWGADPRRTAGDSIHPSRFPIAEIEELRAKRPYHLESQYNLRPSLRTGNIFRRGWWRFYDQIGTANPEARPEGCTRDPAIAPPLQSGQLDLEWKCISIDASGGSTSDTASNVAVVVVGGVGPARYVVEDRTIGPRTFLQTCADAHAAIVAHPDAFFLIEDKANGRSLSEWLRREALEGRIVGVDGKYITPRIELYQPSGKGSKEDRIAAIEPDIAGGIVILCDGAEWVGPWVEEFANYPQGKNDRLDALAQCIDFHREMSYAEQMMRMN